MTFPKRGAVLPQTHGVGTNVLGLPLSAVDVFATRQRRGIAPATSLRWLLFAMRNARGESGETRSNPALSPRACPSRCDPEECTENDQQGESR